MATFDEFYRSLPEDSNKRGDYFEKLFIPWFLKTDPVWLSKVNQVWLWDDCQQRWGRDCGSNARLSGEKGQSAIGVFLAAIKNPTLRRGDQRVN